MTASKIEWTGRSDWNPVRGCTRKSPGCGGPGPHGGCYAEGIAARFSGPGLAFEGFAEKVNGVPRWTGKVEVMWDRLTDPLKWREPATIFALSMSDLFHEALPVEEIATIYAVMVAAVHLRDHTLQVLTKRSERMREIMNSAAFWDQVNAEASAHVMERTDALARRSDDARASLDEYGPHNPPPGIWMGVSVENQKYADERIPDLLATPAAIRFLSCEPLLGPVDLRHLTRYTQSGAVIDNALDGFRSNGYGGSYGAKVDWVITGGESGPTARPSHPDWFRNLRDQCAAADVPYFHKQNGEWCDYTQLPERPNAWDRTSLPGEPLKGRLSRADYSQQPITTELLCGGRSFDTLYPFNTADVTGPCMVRVGKARAGAHLDGVEHRGMPA